MGQYYKPVILADNKKTVKAWVYSHDIKQTHYAQDMFPVAKWVWRELKPSDIKVSRAKTTQGKDLGEYWVSYAQSLTTFRVTDEDLKSFIRDKKIKSILKS